MTHSSECQDKLAKDRRCKADTPADILAISEVVESARMLDQVILYDFRPDNAVAYRAAMPASAMMVRSKSDDKVDDFGYRYRPTIFHIDPSYASLQWAEYFDRKAIPTFVGLIVSIDAQFIRGELDPPAQLIETRPDIVQTNHHEEFIAFLRERDLHPSTLDTDEFQKCDQ